MNLNAPGSPQSPENMQQMKKLMEQEMKSDNKFKSNSNKGYVFTLMPLYAIGLGVFAAYKFLKVSKDRKSSSWRPVGNTEMLSTTTFYVRNV